MGAIEMIVIGEKRTYCFEGIHLPRIYINDVKQVRQSLEVLQRNGSLTNKEMTEETARVRSEDIREIFYLLWRLGFGIDVTKKGKEIAFLSNDKLQSILEMEDTQLKNLVLERLKMYNPFIAVLNKLIEYRKKRTKFKEKYVTKDFHMGRANGGRIDNTHPLLRWGKDKEWGLIKNKTITEKGIAYVNEASRLKIYFVHHTVDLKKSKELNVITHILSDASLDENKKVISVEDILGLLKHIKDFELSIEELKSYLKKLIKIGLPIKINGNNIEIRGKIYQEITPQLYTRFGIHFIDGIDELESRDEIKGKKIDEEKLFLSLKDAKYLIIHDEDIDLKNYPKDSKKISYEEFLEINESIPNLKLKSIILPPGWKPLKVSRISGILLSFVRSGGDLIVFHAPMGRIGSNRNLFNWLPYGLDRVSFVHSKVKNITGYFTFPFGENFYFVSKEKCEEIERESKRYSILYTRYYKGMIILVGYNESKKFFEKYIQEIKTEVNININSCEWVYRYLPSLNRQKRINSEFDLYPILKRLMKDNFNFKFDPKIKGKPGQTDMLIVNPFFCCCEVTPPNTNATGFSKVSEVRGHRDTMIYKNGESGKKRFGDNKVGACVFGPSFTIEAGEDKAGAVDMANAMGVSLISYRDLYELICLNAKVKLTREDLAKIFFNEEKKSDAAIRIYELMNQKGLKVR